LIAHDVVQVRKVLSNDETNRPEKNYLKGCLESLSVILILSIFNTVNSAMYVFKKDVSNLQQQTFLRARSSNQKSNTKNGCTCENI